MKYGVFRTWTRYRFWAEQAKHPELGKPVDGAPGIYVYLCLWKSGSKNGHNLFYRTTPDGIEVLALRHTSMGEL